MPQTPHGCGRVTRAKDESSSSQVNLASYDEKLGRREGFAARDKPGYCRRRRLRTKYGWPDPHLEASRLIPVGVRIYETTFWLISCMQRRKVQYVHSAELSLTITRSCTHPFFHVPYELPSILRPMYIHTHTHTHTHTQAFIHTEKKRVQKRVDSSSALSLSLVIIQPFPLLAHASMRVNVPLACTFLSHATLCMRHTWLQTPLAWLDDQIQPLWVNSPTAESS